MEMERSCGSDIRRDAPRCRRLSAARVSNMPTPCPPGETACTCNHGRMATIAVTHFTDPGCPCAYSASSGAGRAALALRRAARLAAGDDRPGRGPRALRRRRLHADPHDRSAAARFARYGMPFLLEPPRERIAGTGRACRAIVATRRLDPGREEQVLRALQLGWFTTTLAARRGRGDRAALERVAGRRRRGGRGRDRRAATARRVRGRQGARRAPPRAAPPSSRARRARPTGRCATRRLRSSSRAPTGDAWRPAAFSRSRPTTCWSPTSTRSSTAAAPAEEPAGGAARVPRRARHPGGRGDHGAQQQQPDRAAPSAR